MDEKELEKLENLFEKYGVKSLTEVEREKKFLKVKTYEVELNNNQTIYRDRLIKNGSNGSACIIVPLFDNDDVLMVVQPRVFTSRGVLLDFPSGYIENGEEPVNAALRELEEETGYSASSMEEIASYYQDEGISDGLIKVFVARGLKKLAKCIWTQMNIWKHI